MIFLEYIHEKVSSANFQGENIITALLKTAKEQPHAGIVIHKKGINPTAFLEKIKDLATPYSFISSTNTGLSDIGYIEDGPFINVARAVTYPTWIKSDTLVYIHAGLVNQIGLQVPTSVSFFYWLNAVGKMSMPLGIFNYQVPVAHEHKEFSTSQLYRFVKQHYKTRWVLLLLLCHVIYERRFPVFAFAKAYFSKSQSLVLNTLELQKTHRVMAAEPFHYDVIIPTMGRAAYLKDVLEDLAAQTVLPQKVIIVEQNDELGAETELPYVTSESWPFKINHEFIQQTGACNARNRAITQTTAAWILFFDDDLRVHKLFAAGANEALAKTASKVMTFACLQDHEKDLMQAFKQWESFGSGCSIVHREIIEKCTFDMALEHGYGEDVDYGMQIRNAGFDVIYAPQIQILHLKAPIGGFRKPHTFAWSSDKVQPKPSPQIMYHRKKNYSIQQLQGYKMVLLLKSFGSMGTKNPWTHVSRFEQAWNQSVFYAATL